MLNAVEMSSQEAAWYLLNLHMSESSRKVELISTCWAPERRVCKTHKQMEEKLAENSMYIWKRSVMDRYEQRPEDMKAVWLAQFVAWYYQDRRGTYQRREEPKIIDYRNYDMAKLNKYKREMVLLYRPFRNGEVEIQDQNRFLKIYECEQLILEAREEFQWDINMEKVVQYCRDLYAEDEEGGSLEEKNEEYVKSKATTEDFLRSMRDGNDDIRVAGLEKISSILRKRENAMTAGEYCAMITLNREQ